MTLHDLILTPGIIAIVRSDREVPLADVAEALYAGGVRAIEATMTTPGALDSVRSLPSDLRSRMAIGVGTILDSRAAQAAIDAGAQFIVTPIVLPDVVQVCRKAGVPVACGAFSPTEAFAAHESGADFVKIFPAEVLGPGYMRSLLGPLPTLKIIPTGGITPETCRAYLDAGCVALGAGSRLVSEEIIANRDWVRLTERAKELVAAVAPS
jgi:2-dehydro-3-deoxyphosphogluconate aldolase/(4S)-4-hydroxy-2-oxoglutarate aldolase